MSRSKRWSRGLGALVALAMVALFGCTKPPSGHWSDNDPDLRLDWLMSLYERGLANGSTCHELHKLGDVTRDCDRIVREIEGLTVEFPQHDRILMASALLTYEMGQRAKAQLYLDRLLAKRRVHPEAAVLRSQIALEDGNLPLALSLLERQVALAPDHPGLREALAAALYLERDFDGSLTALGMAAHLGSPLWRVAYHRGVIAEASGELADARLHYRECLNQNPDYQPAAARLLALQVAADLEQSAPIR